MKQFPARAPIDFIVVDSIGPLLTMKIGTEVLFPINDRVSMLLRTVLLQRITLYTIAKALGMHWIFFYGLSVEVLSDNWQRFASKVFQDA